METSLVTVFTIGLDIFQESVFLVLAIVSELSPEN
jgi:hypothetical protein